jgi:hypothetical protein
VRAHLFDQLPPAQLEQLREISDVLLDHLLPIARTRGDNRTRLIEEARARLESPEHC